MPQSRQPPQVQRATRRRLLAGERVTPHFHDQAQLVYPAFGLLAATTERGTWMAPPHRAVWVPAGAKHQHQAYGVTDMRALLFPPALLAGQRQEDGQRPLAGPGAQPIVVAVSGLPRELILTQTGPGTRSPAAQRRRAGGALDPVLGSR